jgi:hypothetical protein
VCSSGIDESNVHPLTRNAKENCVQLGQVGLSLLDSGAMIELEEAQRATYNILLVEVISWDVSWLPLT